MKLAIRERGEFYCAAKGGCVCIIRVSSASSRQLENLIYY